jgi:hypothetical protein
MMIGMTLDRVPWYELFHYMFAMKVAKMHPLASRYLLVHLSTCNSSRITEQRFMKFDVAEFD